MADSDETIARRIFSYICATVHRRPRETIWSVVGLVAGVLLGMLLGGVGIAAFGGAIGLPWFIISSILFGVVGNRYGVERDLRALRKQQT